ncbi:MAG TPA: ankyrin repeat domain-containing protein [Bryobacteraceae bacterium]|nr:ankyrin repeat domain-containing protein [Bryobacteraceae bacterium]
MDLAASFKQAAHNDDAPALRRLFIDHPEMKARVDQPIFQFDSPAIVIAASRGNREIVDALLAAGANIDARSNWWAGGFGVLDHDRHEIIPYLIERGAMVDAYAAARHGMIDTLRKLVDANPEVVHMRGGDGQTPLHVASSVEIARFLLDRGADIDARDVDHESTPAQYLVRSQPEVLRYLIERGCKTDILMGAAAGDGEVVRRHLDDDPESIRARVDEMYFPMQDKRAGGTIYFWTLGKHRSPHQVASSFGHENVLQLLLERTPEDLKFVQACATGDAVTAKAILARDAGQAHDFAHANAHYVSNAAEDNNTAAVRLMLECGWPNTGDGGQTPLHWACWHGNVEMAREILRFHPPLDFLDAEHHATPFGWAVHGSQHGWNRDTGDFGATVQALLDAGAVLPPDADGSEAIRKVLRSR